jgi:hypothetical protein
MVPKSNVVMLEIQICQKEVAKHLTEKVKVYHRYVGRGKTIAFVESKNNHGFKYPVEVLERLSHSKGGRE